MKTDNKPLIEKIGIEATDYPDWDYVIDQLINLADKINQLVDRVNQLEGKR